MPTPSIPDEVVEAMLSAFRDDTAYRPYLTEVGQRERMRAAAIAALPLLLEHVATVTNDTIAFDWHESKFTPNPEPLYRLKVSNEQ
jgi:hypothetical protein